MDDRATRLARAGSWLRQARERRGFATARAFATALGVDASLVSNYERGVHAVDDDRAAQIAQVLGMDEIEVRHNLGLWVPADGIPTKRDLEHIPTDDLIKWGLEIARRYPDDQAIQQGARLLITLAEQRGEQPKRTG